VICGRRVNAVETWLHSRCASFIRATNRSWCHAYRPGILRSLRVPDRSPVRVPKRRHAVRWEIGSSSGPFSPREFVAPGRVFKPSGARCSPGFSTSSGRPPSSPWAGASTSPPLTGLAWGPAPSRERFPATGATGAPVGCLSECHRAMRLVGLSRDRRTLMRSRASSYYLTVQRPGAPGS
jgi:hypothetical protein